jgi:FtsP/CotA-like multicopper oxidase with cupredoxin domain
MRAPLALRSKKASDMNRRTLLSGTACAAALGLAGRSIPSARAATPRTLTIDSRSIEVNGRSAKVFGLVGPDGKPGLTFNAGDQFEVLLDNRLAEETMIHWHGLTPPNQFDGVPNMPMPLLKAGEQRSYSFPVGPGGTHWMHAHTLQEQALLAAPLIVRRPAEQSADEQEVVVLLHDFSFTPAAELLAKLKSGSAGHGGMMMQGMDHGAMMQNGSGKNGMTMSGGNGMMMSGGIMSGMMGGMDLNDIAYDAFLANDRTLDDPEVVAVEKGGRVRLRIINGATSTGFTIDLGDLPGELVAVDGQFIMPVKGSRFPLSMGQRADIRVSVPKEGGAFPVLALREGAPERTGIVLATTGAAVSKLETAGEIQGPVLGLDLEAGLQAAEPLAARAADRSYMVHLFGNMADYSWGIAGEPIKVRKGERVEIEMMNMSMMAHPMHLHGHHFQVTGIGGTPFNGAVRDTVLVPPMQTVRVAFDANNPAEAWAFHCHHLYHMASGMMSAVNYDEG